MNTTCAHQNMRYVTIGDGVIDHMCLDCGEVLEQVFEAAVKEDF